MKEESTRTVLVSISGGRTSGYMARWMQQNPDKVAESIGVDEVKLVYVFANTGMEHPDTLRFLRDIDDNFGLGIVWIEGVTQHNVRVSTQHRVVDFDSAYTCDQWTDVDHPFHSTILKYGIPNIAFPLCTREMKLNPIKSYMKSLGLKQMADYHSAIGIRSDESRRVSISAEVQNIIYPLIDMIPADKEDVLEWWSQYEWDLSIPEWLGNCVGCYKKSYKKLKAVSEDFPQAFEFTSAMESMHGRIGSEIKKDPTNPDRTFFRMRASTAKLVESFEHAGDHVSYINLMDDAGCSESCEVFPTELFPDDHKPIPL